MTLEFSSKNLRQRRQALNIGVPAQERSRWAGGRGGEGLQAAARVFGSGTKLHRAKWRSGAEIVQKRFNFPGPAIGRGESGSLGLISRWRFIEGNKENEGVRSGGAAVAGFRRGLAAH